jgi:hypothetical protein
MAFDTIAPRAFARGIPENGEVILLRVPALSAVIFENAEHILEAHDGGRLHKAARAEPGAEQGSGQMPLGPRHLAKWQSFAVPWNEVEVEALLIGEAEDGAGLLFGRERSEEVARRIRHPANRIVSGGRGSGTDERNRRGRAQPDTSSHWSPLAK